MKLFRRVTIFLIFFCQLGFAQERAAHLRSMASIEVEKTVSLASLKSIRLGDIAVFHHMSDAVKEKFSEVEIQKVDSDQKKIVLSSRNLSLQLREVLADHQEKTQQRIMLMVPPKISIFIENEVFSKKSVVSRIIKNLKRRCEECEFRITDLNLPRVPNSLLRKSWTLHSNSRLKGNFSLPVAFQGKNSRTRTFWISGRLMKRKKVPVATRRIPAGSRISEGDFEIVERDITYAVDGIPKKLVGQKLKTSILLGHVIWSGSILEKKALRFGDKTQVVVGQSGWNARMIAIAQGNADVGDTVRLLNPRTRKYISGTVIGNKLVRIE